MSTNTELTSSIEFSILNKKNSFNFIRLVCCFIVIYEHSIVLSGISFFNLNLRGLAVNIFFIMSGFWVTKSYIDSISVKSFFIKRCRKIFPLYYATIFIIALIFVFFTSLRPLEYFTSFHFYKYLFANGIFLNFICPNLPGVFNGLPVNGSLWTLKVEIGFYLILPIILYVYTKISSTLKKQVFLILVYLSSFAYIFIVKKTPNIPAQFVHQLPAYMAYFVSGIFYILNWDFLCKKEFKLITYSLLVIILYFFTSSTFVEIFLPFALTIFVVFFARHLKVFKGTSKNPL